MALPGIARLRFLPITADMHLTERRKQETEHELHYVAKRLGGTHPKMLTEVEGTLIYTDGPYLQAIAILSASEVLEERALINARVGTSLFPQARNRVMDYATHVEFPGNVTDGGAYVDNNYIDPFFEDRTAEFVSLVAPEYR
ncbi:MAG: hypothetical protein JW741_11270 [Sedimentisphaerales bacterium]|nr:hypothetical protein [Sedimentisphaerales bacterium]